jgi:hypothetical protein
MIDRIIDVCARNKFIVMILAVVAVAAAVASLKRIPLDAIPDLSDSQVIIYSRWDRSPDVVEAQVTTPTKRHSSLNVARPHYHHAANTKTESQSKNKQQHYQKALRRILNSCQILET